MRLCQCQYRWMLFWEKKWGSEEMPFLRKILRILTRGRKLGFNWGRSSCKSRNPKDFKKDKPSHYCEKIHCKINVSFLKMTRRMKMWSCTSQEVTKTIIKMLPILCRMVCWCTSRIVKTYAWVALLLVSQNRLLI